MAVVGVSFRLYTYLNVAELLESNWIGRGDVGMGNYPVGYIRAYDFLTQAITHIQIGLVDSPSVNGPTKTTCSLSALNAGATGVLTPATWRASSLGQIRSACGLHIVLHKP